MACLNIWQPQSLVAKRRDLGQFWELRPSPGLLCRWLRKGRYYAHSTARGVAGSAFSFLGEPLLSYSGLCSYRLQM